MPEEAEGANPREERGKEWEPAGPLREALGQLPLRPATGDELAGHLLGLGPHAEEALETLGRLERGGGLSDEERARAAALRRLLALAEEAE